MKQFSVVLTEQELEFARQIVNSDLAVAIKGVDIAMGFRNAVLNAKELSATDEHPAHD